MEKACGYVDSRKRASVPPSKFMAKRDANSTGAGEALLVQWGVGNSIEELRGAWGRDAGADAAIVERLATDGSAAAAAYLVELENTAPSKGLRKEIRRALFRLEQRGIAAPRQETHEEPVRIGGPEIEGFLSASDGNGDQLLWLVRPSRGELLQLFAVINDPNGMRETELHPVTRKVMRAAREDLLTKHAIRIVEVDWRYCDARMSQAYRWAVDTGAHVHGDYLGLRNEMLSTPPADVPHPLFSRLDAAAVAADTDALAMSAALCQQSELRTWFLPPDSLETYLEQMQQAQNSPVLLNDNQKRERMEQIAERAVEEIFSGAARDSFYRRLLDLGYVLHATQRAESARQALAAALALEKSTRGGAGIPLCEALVRLSLGAHLQAAAEREQVRARESLIVTPQEIARAAQTPQRRPR